MDQLSNRSGVASDDIPDDASLLDLRWSSDEDVRKNKNNKVTAAGIFSAINCKTENLSLPPCGDHVSTHCKCDCCSPPSDAKPSRLITVLIICRSSLL